MSPRLRREMWWRGGAAVAAAAAGLLLSCSLDHVGGRVGAAPAFLFVMVLCTATVVLTRGLGCIWGLALGLAVGLATSAGLASQLSAAGLSLGVFIGASSLILCLLGGVAGAARVSRRRRRPERMFSAGSSHGAASFAAHAKSRSSPTFTYALANMADDFCAWMDSAAGRQCYVESRDCSGFDQFVRGCLQQHLQASSVRVYRLSPDGAWLEPLVRSKPGSVRRLSADQNVIARAITSGQALIANEVSPGAPSHLGGSGSAPQPLNAATRPLGAEADDAPGGQHTPRWLLPLRTGARTEVLVTVARIDVPRVDEQRIARALRVQLQLFWREFVAQRMLSRHLCTDRQTGMLARTELMNQVDELVGESLRKPEPVLVLALALEGLRKLDDLGLWRQRDSLIQELSRALRSRIRAEDVLGRFSDERFVVVLRGLDSTLATRVAEKLLATIRTEAIQTVCQPPPGQGHTDFVHLGLRAGLAGTGPQRAVATRPFATFDPQVNATAASSEAVETGQHLLQRALGLVEYARQQRVELATDLMAGVPASLARAKRSPSVDHRLGLTAAAEAVGPRSAAAQSTADDEDGAQT